MGAMVFRVRDRAHVALPRGAGLAQSSSSRPPSSRSTCPVQ
jgi:hypothetical protein